MKRADRKLWQSARTLNELGELMARWLEGTLRSRPGYYGTTDLDSTELTALCARLCRAGFLTHNSQLGDSWEYEGHMRARAWVSGFADDDTLRSIRAACDGTDLIVAAHSTPTRKRFARLDKTSIPVAATDAHVYTATGGQIPLGYIQLMWEGIGDEAFNDVANASQVDIVDPKWERNDLLWPVLDEWASARTAGAA